jgi:hypothetical protein
MSALAIEVPFPVFQDRDGQPLENGYVWLGVANLNPQVNPVIAYFDKALTIPAAQPLRTLNGYISNAGTPAQVYVDAVSFSILVQDSKGSMVYNFADGTGISPDACGVTYNPPFAGGVAYPVCVKLEQTVSVKDFGAVGDGVTDDSAAIQAALNYANSIGGCAIYIPTGTYRKSDLSPVLTMYSNTTLYGDGDSSVIYHEDLPTNPRRDLLYMLNANNVTFKNFKILGTLQTHTNETNSSQTLTGDNITNLQIEGMTFAYLRFFATAFATIVDAAFLNNKFTDIMRDGIHCTQCQNIRVIGNNFVRVADDAVALHSFDAATTVPVSDSMVVTGNTFFASQGVRVLGAKNTIISNNSFRFSLSNPIDIANDNTVFPEGNTGLFSINVADNIIMDSFGYIQSPYVIRIGAGDRTAGVLTTQPGVDSAVFPYAYDSPTNVVNGISMGGYGINISNNIIGWSHKRGVLFSSYGYGQLLFRNAGGTTQGYADPTVTDAMFACQGIGVSGPNRSVQINNNNLFGNSVGAYIGIYLFANNNVQNKIVSSNINISNNIISDCPGIAALTVNYPTTNNAVYVNITNNVFDLDPFFRNANHNSNNTWVNDNDCIAINLSNRIIAGSITENHFKNCSTVRSGGGVPAYFGKNYAYFNFTGTSVYDGVATNVGIRNVPSYPQMVCMIIDGDPTSATFGQIITAPYSTWDMMPTTGRYCTNHVVINSIPVIQGTAGNRYVVTGWVRLTNGSGHVLNTDWAEMRTLTGS